LSGRASREKGARAEREVCAILREHGHIAARTPMSGGSHWKGDIHNPDGGPSIQGHHLEVKMVEKLAIPRWLRQAEADCPEGDVPVLVFRQSRQPWRVVVPLEYWLNLVASDGRNRVSSAKPQ
jgi:Holliday junction resolvase